MPRAIYMEFAPHAKELSHAQEGGSTIKIALLPSGAKFPSHALDGLSVERLDCSRENDLFLKPDVALIETLELRCRE